MGIKSKMTEQKFMHLCDMCGSSFQFGPHRYDGSHLARYDMTVCSTCWKSNWDGWAPHLEERILTHLNARGLSVPERNKAGLLPRE